MERAKRDASRRRRRGLLAGVGILTGAALAYALVSWRRALMPESQMTIWPDEKPDGEVATTETADEVSIYEVRGDDASAEWTDGGRSPGVAVADDAAVDEAGGDVDQPGRVRRHALIDIEGIGPAHAKTLGDLGLATTADLLQAGADPKGREDLAVKTGLSPKLILRWVNQADLFRVKGVGEQYSDLLEAAGVDTVPELAQRRADNLTKSMAEVNEQKRLVRRVPTESQVVGWIESAKGLPRVVTY